MEKLFILMLVILALGITASIFSVTAISDSNQSNLTVVYQRYDSVYNVGLGLHVIHGLHDLNGTIYYYVSSATYTSTYSGESVKIQGNSTLYQLSTGSVKDYKGNITVSLSPMGTLTVTSQIPQLIRLVVNTSGMTELVWAGLASANASITTQAYVNETGMLTLVFTNGTSLANITVPLTVGNHEFSENLNLVQVTSTVVAHSTREVEVQQNFPRRYEPEQDELQVSNGSVNATTNYNTTLAYFNGSLVPALVWKGEGFALMDLGFGKFGVSGQSYYQFSTIEFFGVNGTVLGYVHNSFLSKQGSREGIISNSFSSLVAGELKMVTGHVKPPRAETEAEAEVHGVPVIVVITSNDSAESTAYVNLTHPVYVVEHGHGEGAHLVEVSLNGTYQFFVVTPSGKAINVTVTRPENVTETVVNMTGHQFPAQKIVVNASGNILFNVTLLKNESVVVYKEVNGSLVPLNSTNYFVANGKLVIYDDPSNTYYAVYGASTTSTTSSSTTSTTPSTSSTSSSPSSGNALLYVAIAVVVIIIVAVVVLLMRRV
ncbi:hypothetical protein [Metallosphaera javensis (ex Sakai et al. 2022)]|uniref:hypothetical protein n=1 Tax=Metallosphaera javensis (ex Sakai et al. 2022) TaxID=2775498 RepID=UPI002588E266|nr:MAG: hypothetical protein MjAS7_2554 [Metallosphaera javensis (ex Sakai et al. 2022)]